MPATGPIAAATTAPASRLHVATGLDYGVESYIATRSLWLDDTRADVSR